MLDEEMPEGANEFSDDHNDEVDDDAKKLNIDLTGVSFNRR